MRKIAYLLSLAAVFSCSLSKYIDLDELYQDNTPESQLYSQLYNETMEWGTYKTNLFFGVKDRSPSPVDIGLVWVIPSDNTNPLTRNGYLVRNTYTDVFSDNVTAYWEFHDGWSSSRQIILDPRGNVRFEIDWVKQF
jgi:hypothetical protein